MVLVYRQTQRRQLVTITDLVWLNAKSVKILNLFSGRTSKPLKLIKNGLVMEMPFFFHKNKMTHSRTSYSKTGYGPEDHIFGVCLIVHIGPLLLSVLQNTETHSLCNVDVYLQLYRPNIKAVGHT